MTRNLTQFVHQKEAEKTDSTYALVELCPWKYGISKFFYSFSHLVFFPDFVSVAVCLGEYGL